MRSDHWIHDKTNILQKRAVYFSDTNNIKILPSKL